MRLTSLWLLTVSLVGAPGAAAADPIRISPENSFVSAGGEVRLNNNNKFSAGAGEFVRNGAFNAFVEVTEYVASADSALSSTITSHHILATGGSSAFTTVPLTNEFGSSQANSESAFVFALELDSPHVFDYGVLFRSTKNRESGGDASHGGDESHTVVKVVSPFSAIGFLGTGTQERFHETGLLLPGIYFLEVGSHTTANSVTPGATRFAQAEFSFTFDLTPTPEPASLVLLGSGLVGLISWRRFVSARRA